jgi:hypothetical protein
MRARAVCRLILLGAVLCPLPAKPAAAAGLAQEAYVWQRAWNQPVRDALAQHATNFDGIVALAAEVSWRGAEPGVARATLDYAALAETRRPIGLALRVGPWGGGFSTDDPAATFLSSMAAGLVAEAKGSGLNPAELQIDFDCADSKLEGYRAWIGAIRRKIGPTPLTITALPSWLAQPAFGPLARATDGYVLQVHSLERPAGADAPFTLCDPAAARRAVARAGEIGAPFRVALPTYGYVVAFDAGGRFVGLSAEGPERGWPEGAQLREARTDPLAMAGLVQAWAANHPAAMRGIIWYRLPVAGDVLNLRWPTLAAMMAGRFPRAEVRAESRRVEAGLVEISAANRGELDCSSRPAIEVRWQNARLVAGDGVHGFDLVEDGPSAAKFQTSAPMFRLPAGENVVVGWLRLSEEREVQLEIKQN